MPTSTAARLSLLLAAAAATGCFDPTPDAPQDSGDASGSSSDGQTDTSSPDPTSPEGTSSEDTSTSVDPSATGTPTSTGDPSTAGDTADDTSGESGSDTGTGGEVDDIAPSVAGSTPSDDAEGVLAPTSIEVVFSEPMDTASVEAALDTAALGAVSLAWSADDTIVTIDPQSDLDYATGTSPVGLEPLAYEFTLSTDATDVAGNALDAAWASSFTTARRITVELDHDPAYTGGVTSSGVLQTGSGDDPIVGDHSDNVARRGFMGFAITSLPAGILEIEEARLSANQWLVLGDPIPSLGAAATIAHIAPEALPGGAYASAPLEQLGVFSDEDSYGPDNEKSVDVTTNVAYDYAQGESHTLYRLQFTSATNYNSSTDRLRFSGEVLEVTYLVP